MVTFQYSGTDRAGRSTRGIVSADTIRAARDQLRESGVSVSRINARRASGSLGLAKAWKRRRFSAQLTSYLRELATLLQAAIPLMDAMDICSSQVSRALQEPLVATRDRVANW